MAQKARLFTLQPLKRDDTFFVVVLTPDMTEPNIVSAAWSYALRYTAKGLDLPDHYAAIGMLKQRHPSWTILETPVLPAAVNLAIAESDQPENQ